MAALMAYCRIDADNLGPGDVVLLTEMYHAAVSYMDEAGVAEPEKGTVRRAKYDLCVNAMVLDAWDKRGTALGGLSSYTITENPSFRQKLNQLKLTEPDVSKLDT